MPLELIRGDVAYLYGEDPRDRDGAQLILSGLILRFTLKPVNSETALIRMRLDAEGEFWSASGKGAMALASDGYGVEITLAPEDTDGLNPDQTYRCDLEAEDGSGAIKTLVIENSVRVVRDVTRPADYET